MYLEIYDIPRYMCPDCGEMTVMHHIPENPDKYKQYNPPCLEAECFNCGWFGLWTDKLVVKSDYFLEIQKRSRE